MSTLRLKYIRPVFLKHPNTNTFNAQIQTMKFLPFRQLIILSKLEKKEVIAHLSRNLQTRYRLSIGEYQKTDPPKIYEGFILGDTFSINRVGSKDLFFKPIFEGFFYQKGEDTRIEMSMGFPLGIAACIAFFAALIGLIFLFILLGAEGREQLDFLVFLIPMLSLAAMYGICYLNFIHDFENVKNFFQYLYEEK